MSVTRRPLRIRWSDWSAWIVQRTGGAVHNQYRAEVGTPALTWDDSLANPGPVDLRTDNRYPWDHCSQMVWWRTTERVGCGASPSTRFSGNVVLACRYSPPDNYDGQAPC
jgi:hypothetical protein